jgi:hypothetical protein
LASIENSVFMRPSPTPSKDTDMSKLETLLTRIAQQHLGIETLQTRRSDSLDFHDVAVWCLRDALEAAFNAGVEQGRKAAKSDKANN